MLVFRCARRLRPILADERFFEHSTKRGGETTVACTSLFPLVVPIYFWDAQLSDASKTEESTRQSFSL